jgi:proton-translocating NADH-quinone oxidoreductase chain L
VSDPTSLALIALALPLAASLLSFLMGRSKALTPFAHWPAIVGFGSAAVLALLVLTKVAGSSGDQVAFTKNIGTWFSVARLEVNFSISVDPLSSIMLATVTFIATWIALFSAGYMHDDPGYSRYFGVMGLFVFAMCLLVLADNFLLLIAGWEGVGLCSYLLVGYYYAKPSAAAAARKAFLVTRLGDVGLILGIFFLWQAGGYHTDFTKLFDYIAKHPETHTQLTIACLLLFCGAVGKSAQLPLYVWLPDAMEGPTPVSALIHAATMVTAGVYLLARCAPLFVLSPEAQMVVCVIGGLTAILAAFIALAQNDLKRVLAYSTVSQLGFMFMALGTGGAIPPSIAVTAAIFHLFTHAFFKALLFLCSGSVMHSMGNVIDMRRFAGLKEIMPVTHICFLFGAAALAGVPLLAGFWSKDQVLDTLLEAAEHHGKYSSGYWFVLGVAILTAGMTAFYTCRAYFLTFHGALKTPPEAGDHPHESPPGMLLPLVVLAIGAIVAGALAEGFTHKFSDFIARTPGLHQANDLMRFVPKATLVEGIPKPHFNLMVAGISTMMALIGIGLAWRLYGDGEEELPKSLRGVHNLSLNKLFVDEIYGGLFVTPSELLATAARQLDLFLDSLARLISFLPRLLAAVLRPLQNGLVQFYALGMILGLTVFLAVILLRTIR